MTIEEFINNITGELMDQDPPKLTPETNFKDIKEWSSLTALMIIMMVDEVYQVTLTADDMQNSNTIEDLFNIIKSRK